MSLIITRGLGSSGASNFTLSSNTPYSNRIVLTFSTNITLFGPGLLPESWVFSSSTSGAPVPTASSVSYSTSTVTIYHTEARNGASYTLTIPFVGIKDGSNSPFMGPYSTDFTGVGVAPFVTLAAADDGYHVKVIFSEPVVESEALIPTNYTVTGLAIFGVTKETSQVYELRTGLQIVGQSYRLFVNNIHDLYGNLVTNP